MVIGAILAVLLAALIGVVIVSPVKFTGFWSRMDQNDEIYLQIKALYGLVCYRFNLPAVKFLNFNEGILVAETKVNENKLKVNEDRKDKIDQEMIRRFKRDAKEILLNTKGIKKWTVQTLQLFRCSELKWTTGIGVGDAPHTAVLTGAVWSLKSIAIGIMTRYIPLETTPQLAVNPQYNRMMLQIKFVGEVRVSVWSLILSVIRLLVRIIRTPGGFKAWVNLIRRALHKPKTRREPAPT
ncbi:DUF2953 domain-containing protein [Paenibacillus sp. FJAT-26967]|uniref:DUF2953 domain-containing protein n=1 Tax=Paenibacillus sp. FJAT-26967 TaxID=1729690 RepID=UPI0008398E47|nr:DUF2953 domain-containing protein [Paenibacillus sp. FJAT-26967]